MVKPGTLYAIGWLWFLVVTAADLGLWMPLRDLRDRLTPWIAGIALCAAADARSRQERGNAR